MSARVGLSRDGLVRTAADLADEVGLREVTLSALARRVGVRAPSLYAHVRDGADLHAGVTLLALTEIADRTDRALAGRSARAALVALAGVQRDYAREHPGRFEAAGRLDVEVTAALAEVGARLSEQSRAVLRGYDVPEPEHTHAVRFVGSAVRGFVELEAGGSFAHSDPPPEASWARVLDGLDLVLDSWGRLATG